MDRLFIVMWPSKCKWWSLALEVARWKRKRLELFFRQTYTFIYCPVRLCKPIIYGEIYSFFIQNAFWVVKILFWAYKRWGSPDPKFRFRVCCNTGAENKVVDQKIVKNRGQTRTRNKGPWGPFLNIITIQCPESRETGTWSTFTRPKF